MRQLLAVNNNFTGSASNPLLDKSIVMATGGYDSNIKVGEDWELYKRLAESSIIDNIPNILVAIRQHTGPRLGDRLNEAIRTEKNYSKKIFSNHDT